MVDPEIGADQVLHELGRALYAFQAIEARLKILLPHLGVAETLEPPKGEGWSGRRKYFDSKEMLGNLMKVFQQRIRIERPELIEQEWRQVVQGRNDVVHNFIFEHFAKCTTPEECRSSIEYIKARRLKALPLLRMLDFLLCGFAAALQSPPDVEGEVDVELPDWWPKCAS